MANFDRRSLGNTFPIVKNLTDNQQFGNRTTPEGSRLAGSTQLRMFFQSGSEEIKSKARLLWDATSNEVVKFEADSFGPSGNDITITVDATINSSALSVTVSGSDITIALADDGTNITSTVNEVINAVNNDADASSLVTASLDSGTGTNTVANGLATTNLTGGANSAVDTNLDRIKLEIRTTNRPSSAEQFFIELPGPASPDITNNSNYNSVNEYIADFKAGTLSGGVINQSAQNTAGPQLAAAGFDFSFGGSGNEGIWTVSISGNLTDDQYTVNAPSDNTLKVLPGGDVLVNMEVSARDANDNLYFWGDLDGTWDMVRGFKHYTPFRADLNDDGNTTDIFRVATSTTTSDALTYGAVFDNLARSEVISLIEALDTDISSSVGNDVTGDSAVTAAEGVIGADRVIADIPTVGVMEDRGVRIQLPTSNGAPGDEALEGEARIDTANNALYVYSSGAWRSVSLS